MTVRDYLFVHQLTSNRNMTSTAMHLSKNVGRKINNVILAAATLALTNNNDYSITYINVSAVHVCIKFFHQPGTCNMLTAKPGRRRWKINHSRVPEASTCCGCWAMDPLAQQRGHQLSIPIYCCDCTKFTYLQFGTVLNVYLIFVQRVNTLNQKQANFVRFSSSKNHL